MTTHSSANKHCLDPIPFSLSAGLPAKEFGPQAGEALDEEVLNRFKQRRGEKRDTAGAWIKEDRGKREGRLYPGRLSEKKS